MLMNPGRYLIYCLRSQVNNIEFNFKNMNQYIIPIIYIDIILNHFSICIPNVSLTYYINTIYY